MLVATLASLALLAPQMIAADAAGQATFPAECANPRFKVVDLPGDIWGHADGAKCLVRYDYDVLKQPWVVRCKVAVHEHGHLAGRWKHARNPYSIMYRQIHDGQRVPRRCR
jgi:hypothetical protein